MRLFNFDLLALFIISTILVGCNSASTPAEQLALALRSGRLSEVKRLVDSGGDVTQRFGDQNDSAIHLAARSVATDPELASYLVEQKADPSAKNANEETAWSILWDNPSRPVSEKQGRFLAVLLKAGFTPTRIESVEGETFLHDAARRCHSSELVRLLSEQGAEELDAPDANGWTPLHHAVFEGNYESSAGLLQAGADPNAETTREILSTFEGEDEQLIGHRYEAGSRPLDLYRETSTRLKQDLESLLKESGGESNTAVRNLFLPGTVLKPD